MITLPVRWRPGQDGQGLTEYALILVLIAMVLIASLMIFGTTLSGLLTDIGTSV